MSTERDDFEARLRATLAAHAGDGTSVDLADAALIQARRIRRRRSTLAAASALAVAAIAVPVGVSLAHSSSHRDETASEPTVTSQPTLLKPIRVRIDGLERGPAPSVPYVHDTQFTDADGRTVDLPEGEGEVTDAAELEGTAVWRRDDRTGATRFSTDEPALAKLNGARVTQPAIDRAVGGAAAWAMQRTDASGRPSTQDTLVYAGSLAGGLTTVPTSLQVRQVMGAANGMVVFNAVDHGVEVVGVANMAGTGGDVLQPWGNLKTVTAVSPTMNRIAGVVARGPGSTQRPSCVRMLSAESGDRDWVDCSWRPVEFSADGTRVLAVPGYVDGLGPRELAVLDAANGSILGEFTTPGTFGRATFENDDTIVAVVAVSDRAAIVRCNLAGSCDLATDPQQVAPDDPDALVQPYQLTAN